MNVLGEPMNTQKKEKLARGERTNFAESDRPGWLGFCLATSEKKKEKKMFVVGFMRKQTKTNVCRLAFFENKQKTNVCGWLFLKTNKTTTRLVGLEHAVEPRQQLLGAVVGVQHDRDPVELGHLSYVERHGDGPGDGRLLLGLLVVDALAGEESGTAVRNLASYNSVLRHPRGWLVRRTRHESEQGTVCLSFVL